MCIRCSIYEYIQLCIVVQLLCFWIHQVCIKHTWACGGAPVAVFMNTSSCALLFSCCVYEYTRCVLNTHEHVRSGCASVAVFMNTSSCALLFSCCVYKYTRCVLNTLKHVRSGCASVAVFKNTSSYALSFSCKLCFWIHHVCIKHTWTCEEKECFSCFIYESCALLFSCCVYQCTRCVLNTLEHVRSICCMYEHILLCIVV